MTWIRDRALTLALMALFLLFLVGQLFTGFAEYNDDQLVAIFQLQARQAGMILSDDVLEAVRGVIPPAPRGHTFGNGRFIRNVLEEAISNQATRLSARVADELTERDLRELLPEDIKPPTSMRAEDYLLQQPAT